jgi:hypothetical protein
VRHVPFASDTRFLVAHGLRIKGFAAPAVVADVIGLDERRVSDHLEELRAAGHARLREGRVAGWTLTVDGRIRHGADCAAELDASGNADDVKLGYRRFLDLNEMLLAVCTDWQLVDGSKDAGPQVLNDHSDPAYDALAIARLASIDDAVQPVVRALGASMDRFGGYGARLGQALAKVQSGDHEWFTGAMIESYHTVWFELHEDLLATLGIERSKETT